MSPLAARMLATSWVQIVKAVLMLGAGFVILLFVAQGRGFRSIRSIRLSGGSKAGPELSAPGKSAERIRSIEVSLGLGYMLGLAGLPHVMTRFYTVPGCDDSATFPLSGSCFLLVPSLRARPSSVSRPCALSRTGNARVGNPGGNLTLPLLAQYLGGGKGTTGGDLMLGFVSAVAVADNPRRCCRADTRDFPALLRTTCTLQPDQKR